MTRCISYCLNWTMPVVSIYPSWWCLMVAIAWGSKSWGWCMNGYTRQGGCGACVPDTSTPSAQMHVPGPGGSWQKYSPDACLTGSQRAVSISLAEVKQRLSLRFGMVAFRKLEWGTLVCTVWFKMPKCFHYIWRIWEVEVRSLPRRRRSIQVAGGYCRGQYHS